VRVVAAEVVEGVGVDAGYEDVAVAIAGSGDGGEL
jgi:hypothetical protein